MTDVNDLQRLMVAELIDATVPISVVRNGAILSLTIVPVELT